MSGLFISFEGTDGAGKSTIARQVADRLKAQEPAIVFLEKNNPPLTSGYAMYHMTRLREVLWQYEPTAPLTELGDQHWLSLIASWFFAVQHCALAPLLDADRIVICDGWYYKYLARFLLKAEPVRAQSRQLFSMLAKPDFAIILDVDPKVALSRKRVLRPSETGALESGRTGAPGDFITYQARVRESLFTCCDVPFRRVDTTTLPIAAVVDRASAAIEEALFGATAPTERNSLGTARFSSAHVSRE